MSQNSPWSFFFTLPDWVAPFIDEWDFSNAESIEERMRFAIALADRNVRHNTGGPFGAAVFDCTTYRLIAPGVNCVISSQSSVLHAEITALMLAQKTTGSFSLNRKELPEVELVTSIAPCAMCLGAIPWSGVKRLVCGGRDEDARAIGFDEGSKVKSWKAALADRGIETIVDICRVEAIAVLNRYKSTGGQIYN